MRDNAFQKVGLVPTFLYAAQARNVRKKACTSRTVNNFGLADYNHRLLDNSSGC